MRKHLGDHRAFWLVRKCVPRPRLSGLAMSTGYVAAGGAVPAANVHPGGARRRMRGAWRSGLEVAARWSPFNFIRTNALACLARPPVVVSPRDRICPGRLDTFAWTISLPRLPCVLRPGSDIKYKSHDAGVTKDRYSPVVCAHQFL